MQVEGHVCSLRGRKLNRMSKDRRGRWRRKRSRVNLILTLLNSGADGIREKVEAVGGGCDIIERGMIVGRGRWDSLPFADCNK